jgi:Holliday junction DNA helicase RuvA
VQAVGPKVAMAVLSSGSPRELMAAIAGAEAKRFQAIPGIGKRTAERIIVELREKVGVHTDLSSVGSVAAPASARALAHEGLVALGYDAAEADELLRGVEGEAPEDLIAQALRTARAA